MGVFEKGIAQQEETQQGRYLTFYVGEEAYAIPLEYVTEIIGIQPITIIPGVPGYIKGIINLRGKIIPVVDVRLKFKKQPEEYTERTCIIVIDTGELVAGLIIDKVSDVLTIDEQETVPPPKYTNAYIKGVGKTDGEVKLILDCKQLLNDNV